ncbi:MAG: SDR family oxidoreductase [bacterium]
MDLGLKDKVAIVTGGSMGLGYAVASELAKEGSHVTICSRRPEPLEKAKKSIQENSGSRVHAVRADMSVPEDIATVVGETVERFGTVHILVNNAGSSITKDFLDVAREDWGEIFQTILLGASEACRLAIPYMQKQKWGRIINVGSVSSKQPRQRRVLANAAKAALMSFTKTLAREFVKDGILVNAAVPGRFATHWPERIRKMAREQERTVEDVHAEVVKDITMGRLGEPEEFSAMVAFLASERASFISGAAFPIDGGELSAI